MEDMRACSGTLQQLTEPRAEAYLRRRRECVFLFPRFFLSIYYIGAKFHSSPVTFICFYLCPLTSFIRKISSWSVGLGPKIYSEGLEPIHKIRFNTEGTIKAW